MKIKKKTVIIKILIFSYSSFKFGQKNTQKYFFDVKFPAEHDPGVKKKNKKNRVELENQKKVRNCKITVGGKSSTFKTSTRR